MRFRAKAIIAAPTYSVDKVLAVLKELSKSEIESGKRITISGFPANVIDNVQNGSIDLRAVDIEAAKGIKGALMTKGIMSKITSGTLVSINVEMS